MPNIFTTQSHDDPARRLHEKFCSGKLSVSWLNMMAPSMVQHLKPLTYF